MKVGRLVFRLHAIQRMYERAIRVEDVRFILENGKVIEEYPNDSPHPSCLVLGWYKGRPIHVVAALNASEDEAVVITVYEPDLARWELDRERRRK